MDPIQIATIAVSLLAPYLAEGGKIVSQKAGEASWGQLSALYKVIHKKIRSSSDRHLQEAFQRLAEFPANQSRQDELKRLLVEMLSTDPKFLREVRAAIQEIHQDEMVGKFVTKISGQAKIEKIINIEQASHINIE
ncbi:MAG: hypothetical protein AAGC93_11175 [Cyanobacteria bacterium P01_F01_bin.53]